MKMITVTLKLAAVGEAFGASSMSVELPADNVAMVLHQPGSEGCVLVLRQCADPDFAAIEVQERALDVLETLYGA